MKKYLTFLIPAVLALLLCLPAQGQAEEIPARGKVTLLNLQSDCIPCDLQDRIVNRVKKTYADRVAFIFLDVEKHPAEKEKYGVKILPTLVFYDASGKERDRRTGYLKEGEMKRILDGLLAE